MSSESSPTALRRLTSVEISDTIRGRFIQLADIVGTGTEWFFTDGRYESRAHTPVSGRYEIGDDALCIFIGSSSGPDRCYAILRSSSGDIYRSQLDAHGIVDPKTEVRLTIERE